MIEKKLEFPEESIKLAREIAARYKKRSRSKRDQAANLYEGHFLEILYGFDESIKTGNCGRYLHEIVKEADCFIMAGVTYLVARECGLRPQLYHATGMKNLKEGQDSSELGAADHAFVVCQLGKTRLQMVDQFMSGWGRVTFIPEENALTIYNKNKTKLIRREYACLEALSEENYLNMMERNRTSEGGRVALSATQKLHYARRAVYLTFDPTKNMLTSRTSLRRDRPLNEKLTKELAIEFSTAVAEDGSFDFYDGTLSYFNAENIGWVDHTNAQVPVLFPLRTAKQLWDIWDMCVRASGRKAAVNRLGHAKLEELLITIGCDRMLQIKPDSIVHQTITEKNQEEELKTVRQQCEQSASDFVVRTQNDETSYKVLLRKAHYIREQQARKSPENPRGFIFSAEEHEAVIYQELESVKHNCQIYIDKIIELAEVEARLQKRSKYHAQRKVEKGKYAHNKSVQFFDDLSGLRNVQSFPEC
ncbi:MAG: hypothetical protein RL557_698, partial [archaeon]